MKSESEVAQSCPTLCDTMDCSLPGSSVHGTLQARVLEWGAITFSEWGAIAFSKWGAIAFSRNVYSTFIYNGSKLQTTQLSINIQWLVSKFWYIHTMEYDSSVFKKNELSVYKQYRWILKTFHLCSRNSRMDKNGKNQKVVRRQGNWLGSGRGAFLSDGESHLVLWVCMIVRAHWMNKALCVLLYPISNENP